jgi:hypothetical protein
MRAIADKLGCGIGSVHRHVRQQNGTHLIDLKVEGNLSDHPSQSSEIREIVGAPGWQISSLGIAYKDGSPVRPVQIAKWRANKHKHGSCFRQPATLAVDLGNDYHGPLLPIGAERSVLPPGTRPLDEIVAYPFAEMVGGPPAGKVFSLLVHRDGTSSCAAANLTWTIADLGEEDEEFIRTISTMRQRKRPPTGRLLHRRRKAAPYVSRDTRFTDSPNVPGHKPVPPTY